MLNCAGFELRKWIYVTKYKYFFYFLVFWPDNLLPSKRWWCFLFLAQDYKFVSTLLILPFNNKNDSDDDNSSGSWQGQWVWIIFKKWLVLIWSKPQWDFTLKIFINFRKISIIIMIPNIDTNQWSLLDKYCWFYVAQSITSAKFIKENSRSVKVTLV